jgi:SAM-dependent methyltransferase
MPRSKDEQAHTERLDRGYVLRQSEVFREIERETLGCDYGGTSWTSREEAEGFAELLGLRPGVRALELGAGSGWPALHLARQTGCRVTLADLPREGLRRAVRRAAVDDLAERCVAVVADGATLPFPDARFDAVYHCDVLC